MKFGTFLDINGTFFDTVHFPPSLKQYPLYGNGVYLYQQIDDILWYDWDPIGINDMATRDEYQSYTPQIFELVKSSTDKMVIAKTLSKIETDNMGLAGSIEKCLKIADKTLWFPIQAKDLLQGNILHGKCEWVKDLVLQLVELLRNIKTILAIHGSHTSSSTAIALFYQIWTGQPQ